MATNIPTILALDFDGVICDGLVEYFETTKRTYLQIWNENERSQIDELAPSFYRLRSVIESGWEMPVLLRALVLGVSDAEILQNWSNVASNIIKTEGLEAKEITKKLDTIRDNWIESDLEGWLELHRFYPGIIERLQEILNSTTKLYIVTTKEGRFVKRILEKEGINLSENSIIGKESKLPKYQTLRQLIEMSSIENVSLWFVEDRLKTLQSTEAQSDLETVQLFLADWGYNTQQDRDYVSGDAQSATPRAYRRIQLLSLQQFRQDFSAW